MITAAVDPAARKRLEAASTSYKLALNSIYGKLKSPYSSLFDSQCQIAVALTGQLLLINLIEQLQAAGCGVVSANTDGLFLRSPRGDERWQGVLEQWQSRTGLRLEREPLQRLVILANNFAYITERGQHVRKGDLDGPGTRQNPELPRGPGRRCQCPAYYDDNRKVEWGNRQSPAPASGGGVTRGRRPARRAEHLASRWSTRPRSGDACMKN